MARSLRRRARLDHIRGLWNGIRAMHPPLSAPPAVVSFVLFLAFAFSFPLLALGQDGAVGGSVWPQFRGPNVDGTSPDENVFTNVGGFRLEVAWKTPIGGGYSGLSIANELAVTAFDTGEATVVAAFDANTGEEQWRSDIGRSFPGINGSYAGPISTPLIAGSAVIALDRGGSLVALDAASGDRLWAVVLPDQFDAVEPGQGFATSPILYRGAVIVKTGGPGAAVTAFDPAAGSQLWTVGDDSILYQTPVPVTLGGREQLVAAGFTKLMGIDPGTGELLWQYSHEGDGWAGAESLVPVPTGPATLFLSHSDHSSMVVELEPGGDGLVGRERWDQRTIRASYTVPVYHDGHIYGYNRRFLV